MYESYECPFCKAEIIVPIASAYDSLCHCGGCGSELTRQELADAPFEKENDNAEKQEDSEFPW